MEYESITINSVTRIIQQTNTAAYVTVTYTDIHQ